MTRRFADTLRDKRRARTKSGIFLEKARLEARNTVLIARDEKRHLPVIKRRFHACTQVDLTHVVSSSSEKPSTAAKSRNFNGPGQVSEVERIWNRRR